MLEAWLIAVMLDVQGTMRLITEIEEPGSYIGLGQ